ncbi:hypothetical protein CABS01_11281 [Colletotrichum abscissum]|uniref:Uncharacterized protein n=2 Tax=Colletotrichum acutatum species complex TaxID=2707335 RepID=A0A9Q0AYC6_9PEZI|nr:uncharacterized protein CLUP02_04516 [Colletotrichum lupini]XP_060397884.1 uncharacterized protein CABS01_11281 [Colletotrichum abscissum]KAI3545301.1 hypothetical protein CABS02_09421 [Colletotrichum abscissum]KAK1495053.1 hypothetical protein CABS01_11281 [Colletotrichum abscissum]KAK1709945.1 hypothetical protein BDP67DRAFT_408338 [Colletotrichum lupini]UQC79037.1 hypothetical protein CLUP02_04516 [Colletotrichum lupini]
MIFFITRALTLLTLSTLTLAQDEPKGDGYVGYELNRRGDNESAVYETANTKTGIDTLNPIPDVYLNASVSVGEISIEVQNITAKVNLDAKVLNLLHFQAGVDASIDRVKLGIYNVSAKVELEARLENVVKMVDDVLTSIDLNPIIATLGDTVSDIVNKTVDVVTDPVESSAAASAVAKRDLTFRLEHNILYSVNDFSGRTHTNRVLAQNGSLFDVYLDNSGNESGRKVVGFYSRDMTFSGHNKTISIDGQVKEFELQYVYAPYPGLEAFSNIYLDTTGKVVRTKIVAEAEGGGTATISNDDESIL